MASTVVNNWSDSELASPTFSFDYGVTPTEGNLLVATISRNLGVDDIDTPVGWTKVFSGLHSSATTAVFWKIATDSESTFQDFTSSTSGGKWAGGMLEISGFNPASTIDVSGTGTGLSLAPISPAVTTTVANTLLIAGFGVNNDVTATASAGLTAQWSQSTLTPGGEVATAGGTIAQVATGLTSAYTHSISGATDQSWFAYTIAITPEDSISLEFIETTADTYEPSLSTPEQIDVGHISTTIAMYEPIGSNVAAQQLDCGFISSSEALYEPFGFNYDLIESTEALYEPTLSGSLTLTVDYISTGNELFEPLAYPDQLITVGFISSGEILYEPDVTTVLAQQLDAGFISTGNEMFEPQGWLTFAQQLDVGYISTGNYLFDIRVIARPTFLRDNVQYELDQLLGENVIDIYARDVMGNFPDGGFINWYCVGNFPPYVGKSMWVRTFEADTDTAAAADIANTMYQDGNSDPEIL